MARFRRIIDVVSGEETTVPFTQEQDAEADAAAAVELAIVLPERIRAECSRRIFAVANSNAQMNMASFAAAGLFNAEQMSAYTAGLQWVGAMRAKCTALIAAADPAFASDAAWPACPQGAAALAAQF